MKRMADKSIPQWLGIGLAIILSLAVVSCAVSGQAAPVSTPPSAAPPTVELALATATLPVATATPAPPTATATATPTSTPVPKATPDLAKVKPNELGRVPVFVYHLIGDAEGPWTRTPANFRKDLERLYRLGYRTVKLSDYLSGNIDLPAGTSPVVLTFDDSSPNQFRLVYD